MTDLLAPTDPSLSPASLTQAGLGGGERARFNVGGTATPLRATGVPAIDQWTTDWQLKNLGRILDPVDHELINQISKTFNGRPLLPSVQAPQPELLSLDQRPREANIDWNPMLAAKHGFDASLAGSFQRWMAVDGSMHFETDPSYDPWGDPDITRGKFKDRPELFAASRSNQESRWLMGYLARHEKEGSQLEAMTGNTGLFETAGGMLGDPLTYVPATLGFRGAMLSQRAGLLKSPETIALGFKPVVLGGLADGMRAAGAQGALALVDAGLHKALDPASHDGSVADIVALPAGIAAGVGFLTSAYGRYHAGMNAIEQAAGNEAFLAGTRARARNLATGEGPAAPGALAASERAYWEKAAAANPDGRFHIDGQVLGYGDNVVHFRTAEGLDVTIPPHQIDMISEKGARGIVVSADRLAGDPALMGSAMKLDGQFEGGGIPRLFKQTDAAVAPGSLASDYTTMRAEEMVRNGTVGGLRHTPDFDQFMAGNKVVDAEGKPVIVYHGTTQVFDEHSNAALGSYTHAKSARMGHFFSGKADTANAYVNPTGPGNVRPSYIQMKKPLEVTDNAAQDIRAAHVESGRAETDINGQTWIARDGKWEEITEGRLSPEQIRELMGKEFMPGELEEAVHTGRTADSIKVQIQSANREVYYADTIARAKKAGHDGVIIRNTADGGPVDDVYIVFNPKTQIRGFDQRWQVGHTGSLDDVEIAKGGGSLSAGGTGSATSRSAQLAGNRLVKSGIGLEKLPFDVINRAAMLPFTTWQITLEDMLSAGGRLRMKNTAGFGWENSAVPVEMLARTNWNRPMAEVVRGVRDEWQLYRQGHAPIEPTDAQRIGFELKTTIKDKLGMGSPGMSFEEFRRRVGDALINADKDLMTDGATPQVEAAAARTRGLLEKIKQGGMDSGLFREAHEEQLAAAEGKVAGLKKNGGSADAIAAAEARVDHIRDLLADVINQGPSVTTAKSYRPRYWLVSELRDRAPEFKQIVDDWLRQSQPQLGAQARKDIATDIHETLLRDKPVWTKKEVQKNFNDLADPGSAKARTFEIPDMLVKDFLENDVEAIVRSHTRTMGTAIEMHKRFGSTGLEDEIGELSNEANLLVAAAPTNAAKKEIMKQHDLALADLEASRDRLYGVYGAPDDPHRWDSRAIRMAKQFTNLTVLGMSGVSAMADLVRPLMTEGLQAVHDYGFRTLASDSRSLIFKMSRRELEHAGDAMELILNTRALSMSDAGDAFRSRSGFERGLAKANSWFFVANGLNSINQLDKEWAGVIIQGNANRAMMRSAVSLDKTPDWQRARLAAAGIDESMMNRIAAELNAPGGSNRFGKLVLADTEKWTDEEAAKTYRSALNQMVNRTVPTPTLGDTPNWFSSELGSLITQYKSFAFGALNRSLFSGLQEGGNQFWYGAAAMTGFALLLNEMRSRLFYDRSTFDKPMTATIMDAVDRSSILGYFSDANRSLEVLTGHRAGLRPMVGGERAREESGSRVVGALAGPAAGQGANALQVLGDFLALHPTAKTFADARQLIPGQNLPYLDPAFDALVSDGRRYPSKEEKRKTRARPGE